MTPRTRCRCDVLVWTALGVRMGFTRSRPQREEILAAVGRMAWTPAPTRPLPLAPAAARAVVKAVVGDRRDRLRRVGHALLPDGRQLFGLENARGNRSYVLDLDSEAIVVLAERSQPPSASQRPGGQPGSSRTRRRDRWPPRPQTRPRRSPSARPAPRRAAPLLPCDVSDSHRERGMPVATDPWADR